MDDKISNPARTFVQGMMQRVAAFERRNAVRPGGGVVGKASARPGHVLTRIRSGKVDDRGEPVYETPNGHLTERRAAPGPLARLPDHHAHVAAARIYASLVEREGTVSCNAYEGGAGGAPSSDGGAAARADRGETLRRIRAAIGDDLVLNPRGDFAGLDRRALVDAVVLDQKSIGDVVSGTGRSLPSKRAEMAVRQGFKDVMHDIAACLGLETD